MNAAPRSKWIEAGGEAQIPFLRAARKVLTGESVQCPKCHAAALRYYFHVLDRQRLSGTIWAWCSHCFTKCHLPRVPAPTGGRSQIDPFEKLTLDEFAELELDPKERFLDRLNRLWDEGTLRP
jgi:hypothetical protein